MGFLVMCYALLWYLLSNFDSQSNKIFYVHYPYPVLISVCHIITNVILLYAVLVRRGLHRGLFHTALSTFKYTFTLGLIKVALSISAHMSYMYLTLAYSQTIKTLSPILVIMFSKLLHQKGEPTYVYVSILLMSVGVTLCTCTEYSLNVIGLVASVGSVGTSALNNFFSKTYITKFNTDSFVLAFNVHVVALFLVIPIWMCFELSDLLSNSYLDGTDDKIYFGCMCLLQGLLSFGCHSMKASLLPLVSSVGFTIIDSGKSIFKIVVAMVVYSQFHSMLNIVGILVAVLGAMVYIRKSMSEESGGKKKD